MKKKTRIEPKDDSDWAGLDEPDAEDDDALAISLPLLLMSNDVDLVLCAYTRQPHARLASTRGLDAQMMRMRFARSSASPSASVSASEGTALSGPLGSRHRCVRTRGRVGAAALSSSRWNAMHVAVNNQGTLTIPKNLHVSLGVLAEQWREQALRLCTIKGRPVVQSAAMSTTTREE